MAPPPVQAAGYAGLCPDRPTRGARETRTKKSKDTRLSFLRIVVCSGPGSRPRSAAPRGPAEATLCRVGLGAGAQLPGLARLPVRAIRPRIPGGVITRCATSRARALGARRGPRRLTLSPFASGATRPSPGPARLERAALAQPPCGTATSGGECRAGLQVNASAFLSPAELSDGARELPLAAIGRNSCCWFQIGNKYFPEGPAPPRGAAAPRWQCGGGAGAELGWG